VDALEAKRAVAAYYLWRRHCPYVATEYNFKDVYVIDENMLSTEVEIKVDSGDLRNEIRTIKHILGIEVVEREKIRNLNKYRDHWTNLKVNRNDLKPNRFYFGVPKELVEKAVNGVKKSPYGVIEIGQNFWECKVIKRSGPSFCWEGRGLIP
jgi:hypothetical protein